MRVLFSKGPFISVFASDPHIIIKAINQNLNSVLRDSNINGHDYMRNIVHLPVFLNSRGLSSAKKMCAPTPANGDTGNSEGLYQHGLKYSRMSCVSNNESLLWEVVFLVFQYTPPFKSLGSVRIFLCCIYLIKNIVNSNIVKYYYNKRTVFCFNIF